jgi:hypothetical protein
MGMYDYELIAIMHKLCVKGRDNILVDNDVV